MAETIVDSTVVSESDDSPQELQKTYDLINKGILNCKIPRHPNHLQLLQDTFIWVPGRESIRPDPYTKERKAEYLLSVCNGYQSEADYVLQTIFGFSPDRGSDGRFVVARTGLPKQKVFERNMFSYLVPEGTRHFVMWYTYVPPETEISQDIYNAIKLRIKHERFDFVWYQNPKMNIPEVFHVQTFWRVRQS